MKKRIYAGAVIGLSFGAAAMLTVFTLLPQQASADQTASKTITCEEKIPKGAKRPKIKEKFPGEVVAGFEAPLELEIHHGKGETPLPSGFKAATGSTVGKFLEEAGFLVAEPDGSSGVTLETQDEGNGAVTKVRIPFVVAPQKSGNQSLTLPQMPLTIGRANGDMMTVCTQLHLMTALDPTAGEEDPKPRPNPDPRAQTEAWPLMKYLLAALIGLLIVAAILAWWVRKQLKKPVPQPLEAQRLPWEEALAELQSLASSPVLGQGSAEARRGVARSELFDRVSDTLRKYLGARYGFEGMGLEGLDTTTDEMLGLLKRVRPNVPSLDLIQQFLAECDLVKFARVVPDIGDCKLAMERAETVVRATIPIAPAVPVVGAPTIGQVTANAPPAPAPVAPTSPGAPIAIPPNPTIAAGPITTLPQATQVPKEEPTGDERFAPKAAPAPEAAPAPKEAAAPLPVPAPSAPTLVDSIAPIEEAPIPEPKQVAAAEPVPAPTPAPAPVPAPTPTPAAVTIPAATPSDPGNSSRSGPATFTIPGRHSVNKPPSEDR
ncbi:MAG: hypothetical protein HOW73_48235 [Polyangiaceae bacterium]|nr:hypothetical protein [Polyangiaceae bacterium]